MNIVFAADDNVVQGLAACLNSISMTNRQFDPHVYILESKMSDANIRALRAFAAEIGLNTEFLHVPGKKLSEMRARMRRSHITSASLYRCTIGETLPSSLKKVLYLDVDTLVLGPLDDLFKTDLRGAIAGVVSDDPKDHLADFGVKADHYFNSGVMLIDLEKWRTADIDKKLPEIFESIPERLKYWDQCALNIILRHDTFRLDPKYNYMHFRHASGSETVFLPSILHFAGSAYKPWDAPQGHPFGILYCNASAGTPWPTDYRMAAKYTKETRILSITYAKGKRNWAIWARSKYFWYK